MSATMKKIEITGAVTLVLILTVFMLGGPSITGFQSKDFVVEDLDLDIDESQSYTLSTDSQEEMILTSLKLSGRVEGKGRAEVYLDNGKGQRLLIFSNVRKTEGGMDAITGMSIREGGDGETEPEKGTHLVIDPLGEVNEILPMLKETEELVTGVFGNECEDTCYIRMGLSQETVYKLVFLVDEGTNMQIDKVFYTLDV